MRGTVFHVLLRFHCDRREGEARPEIIELKTKVICSLQGKRGLTRLSHLDLKLVAFFIFKASKNSNFGFHIHCRL